MNLLEETIQVMDLAGVQASDVEWVGSEDFGAFTWDEFAAIARMTEYDNDFGAAEVATDLVIVGGDWWMTRGEYDGREWWDFHRTPERPAHNRTPDTLAGGMWCGLKELNDAA